MLDNISGVDFLLINFVLLAAGAYLWRSARATDNRPRKILRIATSALLLGMSLLLIVLSLVVRTDDTEFMRPTPEMKAHLQKQKREYEQFSKQQCSKLSDSACYKKWVDASANPPASQGK